MDKDDWKGFLRFLGEVKEGKLHARLDKARSVLRLLKTPEVRSAVIRVRRRVIRLLEQELLFRQGTAAPTKGSR